MNCFALDTISKRWVELKLSITQRIIVREETHTDTHSEFASIENGTLALTSIDDDIP